MNVINDTDDGMKSIVAAPKIWIAAVYNSNIPKKEEADRKCRKYKCY